MILNEVLGDIISPRQAILVVRVCGEFLDVRKRHDPGGCIRIAEFEYFELDETRKYIYRQGYIRKGLP